MTPYQKINLVTFLLATIRDGGGARGLSENQLMLITRREGYSDLTAPQLLVELRGQADKALLISYESPLGEKLWRITAQGSSVLAEQGI